MAKTLVNGLAADLFCRDPLANLQPHLKHLKTLKTLKHLKHQVDLERIIELPDL